jgi:hypothetical protein
VTIAQTSIVVNNTEKVILAGDVQTCQELIILHIV